MADSKLSALSDISVPDYADYLYTVDDTGPTSNRLPAFRAVGNWRPSMAEGRLTTESGVAVSTSDQSAQGTIYYTPYNGNRICLFDGTRWKAYVFTERSLALTVTSGKNYDVFLYDNAGTLTLELSAAWTNDTTRADALTTQDGVPVKSGTTTRRWLGTIRASGANVTADSGGLAGTTQVGAQRFIWNAFNQVPRPMTVIDKTDSWSYATGTIRQANAAAGNKCEWVTGDAASEVEFQIAGTVFIGNTGTGTEAALIGIGIDSTTTMAGVLAATTGSQGAGTNATDNAMNASYRGLPGLGYHFASWNEKGATGTGITSVFTGDNAGDGRQTGLMGGMLG